MRCIRHNILASKFVLLLVCIPSMNDVMGMISYRHEALNDYNECHKHYSVTMPAIDLIASLIAPTATLAPDAHRCDEHFAWKDADTIHINYIDMPSPNVIGTLVDNFAYSYLHPTAHKDSVWFRHGDHLGSTSWVTNAQGTAVQHVVYMPYGYIFNTWQASTYNDQLKYTGKERDAETNYDYFGARYYAGGPNAHADPGAPTYNPNIGPFWLSVDPLADQYPDISPYAYCGWKPMKYVDPDGRENVIALSNKDSRTPGILSATHKFENNKSVIHLWAHGYSDHIALYVGDEQTKVIATGADHLNQYLFSASEIWNNRDNGDNAIIVLHSCSTGAGKNSLAQQISKDERFENVIIVAPSKDIQVFNGEEYGPADTNGENVGEWRMFLNGILVDSFKGTTAPIFKNPNRTVEKYKINDE